VRGVVVLSINKTFVKPPPLGPPSEVHCENALAGNKKQKLSRQKIFFMQLPSL
jgi:hypothetical protein